MEKEEDNKEKTKKEDITELEGYGIKRSWSHRRSHFRSNIYLEGLRKISKYINQDNPFLR
jgi:hypothetical protein